MKPLILLIILYVLEIVFAPKKKERYRNLDIVFTAIIVCAVQLVFDIILSLFNNGTYYIEELGYVLAVLQGIAIFAVRAYCQYKDSFVKYGLPQKYTTGRRAVIIRRFYDCDDKAPAMYVKGSVECIGVITFVCAVFLTVFFTVQYYSFASPVGLLASPYAAGGLVSLLIEFSIFCSGESRWADLMDQYKAKRSCKNARELAEARYHAKDEYDYAFIKNKVWEDKYILRATKLRWKKDTFKDSITYYNFTDRSVEQYDKREHNEPLERFIKQNELKVNDLYVAAYNLIDRNENVLIKTPSYADFEPYFASLIKMKIAKTQKVVIVVSSEEKKQITKEKIENAFKEYFGFQGIPVVMTIDQCASQMEDDKKRFSEHEASYKKLEHYYEVYDDGARDKSEFDFLPQKEADIIIAAPEDVCDPELTHAIHSAIKRLGLIVYYDFSDCVQEEALFARIIHSVLDYDDKISTLYMSDGFFDLEQVLDNFFSKRNLYKIVVPRESADVSFVMGWKAENINEMQSRTVPDASRNIGTHIPILYDVYKVKNDYMVIEDEYDAYSENRSNIAGNPIASKLDCHVGWSDVYGGNSVFCTVSDTYNNIAHTYLALRGIGRYSEYINIISRPYLLRGYLMYHLRHFALNPKVLSTYSPGVIKTARAISHEAVIKSYIAGCTEEQLVKYIADTDIECEMTPEAMLRALVQSAYGEPIEEVTVTFDLFKRYYIDADTYKKIIEKSGFIQKVEFVNNQKSFKRNRRDFCYLIPNQKIVLNGIKYTVESIKGNRIELTDAPQREAISMYRTVRSCTADVKECATYGNFVQHSNGSSISFRQLIGNADITVHGNIVFKDSYHPLCENCRFDYYEISEKQEKHYDDVNIFSIKIKNPLINASNKAELAKLTAMLLNEMLPTFFPRCCERILVCCNDWRTDKSLKTQNVDTSHIVTMLDINDPQRVEDDEICLYILEDAPMETGLVNVFWQDEEVRYMLKVMEDYLYYQEMIRREEREEIFKEELIPTLHTLRKVLLRVINDTLEAGSSEQDVMYANSIRRSRNKFNSMDLSHHFNMKCDFCGRPIYDESGEAVKYHFYNYSGMVSCNRCYQKAVCAEKYSYEEVQFLRETVDNWFYKQYKETVDNSFYNYLEDTEFMVSGQEYARRFVITDDCDSGGVLGISRTNVSYDARRKIGTNEESVAVTLDEGFVQGEPTVDDVVRAGYLVDDKRYSFIFIRDGLEYNEYMAVLCHEMVHQWQLSNLDTGKMLIGAPKGATDEFGCPVDLLTFRLEGQAEWERIMYLKKHRGAAFARREANALRVRRDPYGYGFVWMEKMMKVGQDDLTIPVLRDAKFRAKRNYYQLTKNSFKLMRLYFGLPGKDGANEEIPEGADSSAPSDSTDPSDSE